MARPELEYTAIDSWAVSSPSGSTTVAMAGPSGTKPLITLMFSGSGTTNQLLTPKFTSSAFSDIGCTFLAMLTGAPTSPSLFMQYFYAYDVPIGGAATTYLEFGADAVSSGGVESAYWSNAIVTLPYQETGVGLLGGNNVAFWPGIDTGPDDVMYGMIMGFPSSDWSLAGGAGMETIYPSHGTDPPTFTNDQSVLVGGVEATGAPKVCCGFVREPSGGEWPFAFDFGTSTTWRLAIMRITSQVAVGAPFVTILG